jgi:thiamine-phosphate pyrophosphorylase
MNSTPKPAAPRPPPRLYLVTPRIQDAGPFTAALTAALAAGDVAAILLRFADADERTLINCAKALVPVAQQTEAALVLDGHAELAARSGADGAHLADIADFVTAVETLKPDRIAGAGGLNTRHDAMTAAEAGADYVMFGEPDAEGHRPGFAAIEERIAWWAEVFEAPCVGFAASLDEIAPLVAAGADFVALGDWIWSDPQGAATIIAKTAEHLRLPETAA